MERIFRKTFRRNGKDYKIQLGFDDAAIMENAARFELKAGIKDINQSDWKETTIQVDVLFDRKVIELTHEGRTIGTIPLDFPVSDTPDAADEDIDIDAESTAIEELIGSIPTDPFLGCIIKGAASTAVGQIIRCWRRHHQSGGTYRELAGRIAGCLRDYAGRMLLRFMWRAGRCAVTGGLS